MTAIDKQDAKLLALRLIPLMMNKVAIDQYKIKDLPAISDVEHMLAVMQFIYGIFQIVDEKSDFLKRPQKMKLALKSRYVKYLKESLYELKIEEHIITEILSKTK